MVGYGPYGGVAECACKPFVYTAPFNIEESPSNFWTSTSLVTVPLFAGATLTVLSYNVNL